ncbi:MAG: DNA adenine methylase [Chitinophagaceae bacterium]|nr:DNA adenine methylase [Chitinophagaceae bacterium]
MLIDRIRKIATLRHRIHVSNLDGISFVNKLNKRKDDVFIYLDPPYFLKGADLYMNFYRKKDHEKLATYVSKMKKRWMVSYDNQEFILNLYQEQSKVLYKLSQCASNRVGDEILIFSDGINY